MGTLPGPPAPPPVASTDTLLCLAISLFLLYVDLGDVAASLYSGDRQDERPLLLADEELDDDEEAAEQELRLSESGLLLGDLWLAPSSSPQSKRFRRERRLTSTVEGLQCFSILEVLVDIAALRSVRPRSSDV